jgi:CBS domain-containing membrane protein
MTAARAPFHEAPSTETVRRACIDAALSAYEEASIRGLCREGAWEAAVGALRTVDLDALGTRSDRRVRDAMTREVATLRPDDELSIARDVMRLGRIRHLPVVDAEERLCGLVSHRDLLRSALLRRDEAGRAPGSDPRTLRVSEVMTREVAVTSPDEPLRDAAAEMFRRKLGCLPVLEGGRLVGIVTEADFVRLAL